MAAIEHPQFEEFCRICATKITMVSAINIFKTEGTIRQISKKICTCLPIQVQETDKLPKNICKNCLHKLDSFYDFRESSAQSEKLFLELYEEFSSTQAHTNQQSFIVPMDRNELVVVQHHQILDEDSLQLTHLGEGKDAIVKHEIILTPDNVNMNPHSLIVDVDNRGLSSQDISNHSFQTQESITVDSQADSGEDSLFTLQTMNLMQEHQLPLQQHDLDVNMTDINSGSNMQLTNIECDTEQQNQNNNFHIKIECDEIKLEDEDESLCVDYHLNNSQEDDGDKEMDSVTENLKQENINNGHSLQVGEQLNNSVPSSVTGKPGSLERSSSIKELFSCVICEKAYEEKSEFEEHCKTHLYKCGTCSTAFSNVNILMSHRKEAHGACQENTKGKELEYVSEIHPREKHNISASLKDIDRAINIAGDIVQDRTSNIEYSESRTAYRKKTMCRYCCVEVTHFPRHLVRHHPDEDAVKEFASLPKSDPTRKMLLNVIRRQGNYVLNTQASTIRPIRRPRKTVENEDSDIENYAACDYCLGFLKKRYLQRHMKKCRMSQKKVNDWSETQAFAVSSAASKTFYDSLRLRKEVLESMKSDEVLKIIKGDILICSYGEIELKKHNQTQITKVSKNIRQLGRLLLMLRNTNGAQRFIDFLKPEYFDNIVSATKVINGYHEQNRFCQANSLAFQMGPKLRQICDIATKLILKKKFLLCDQPTESLKSIQQLKKLIERHWNSEISSLTLRDPNEKHWEKPKLLSLISDLMQFQKCVIQEANVACENIKKNEDGQAQYEKLSKCILALTLLLNGKRIREVQFVKLQTYFTEPLQNQQQEFFESLSESWKILSQSFKRVVTGGVDSKPVGILFSKKIQLLIDVMLSVRHKYIPQANEYLFANPETESKWLSGFDVLRKLSETSSVVNKKLFTSTMLQKQIATILQITNISESEMEKFANYMGHTKETYEEYYRLPLDIYQTAKFYKLLHAIDTGTGACYKGKTLDEIEFSDSVESDDSDTEEKDKMNDKNCLVSLMSKASANLNADQHIEQCKIIAAEDEPSEPCCSGTSTANNPVEDNKGRFERKDSVTDDTDKSETNNPVGDNKRGFKRKDRDTDDTDKSETDEHMTNNTSTCKIQRVRWTEMQRDKICDYFRYHIENKIAPKKNEVEKLRLENKELFKERNWVKIKAYVYNCYRMR